MIFLKKNQELFFLIFLRVGRRVRDAAAAARPAGLGSMARGPRWTQSHEPGRGELFPRPRNAVTRDCSASPANTAADDHTFLQASDVQVKIVRTVSKSAGACRGGLAAPGRPGEPSRDASDHHDVAVGLGIQGAIKTNTFASKGFTDRKSTRLNSSHSGESRMPSSA